MKRLYTAALAFGIFGSLIYLTLFISLSKRFQHPSFLRVGFSIEPPYSYIDSTGIVRGQSPDELRIILRRIGIDSLQWKLMEFGSLLTNLEAGRIDAIATGMFITPERAKRIAFSSPTLGVPPAFLVKKGNPKSINKYADFRDRSDIVLGVLNGAIELSNALALGIPQTRIRTFPDAGAAVDALRHEEVDCFALSSPSIEHIWSRLKLDSIRNGQGYQLVILPEDSQLGYTGFGFRKQDSLLVREVNTVVTSFVGSDEHIEVMRRYGFTKSDLPRLTTVAEVLRNLTRSDLRSQ